MPRPELPNLNLHQTGQLVDHPVRHGAVLPPDFPSSGQEQPGATRTLGVSLPRVCRRWPVSQPRHLPAVAGTTVDGRLTWQGLGVPARRQSPLLT